MPHPARTASVPVTIDNFNLLRRFFLLRGIKRDKGQSNNVIRNQIINMATVSASVSALLVLQLQCFRRLPFLAHESRDELHSYSKKTNKRPEDAGLRTFQPDIIMESILKGRKLILESKLGE